VNKILVNLLLAALNSKQVQDAAGDFISRLVTQKLLPLLPVLAAAAAKAVTDQIPELARAGQRRRRCRGHRAGAATLA